MGEVAILSVGAGDTKLIFDNKNPAETIRAGRIVSDMLHRGYALLVEVEQRFRNQPKGYVTVSPRTARMADLVEHKEKAP